MIVGFYTHIFGMWESNKDINMLEVSHLLSFFINFAEETVPPANILQIENIII